MTATTPAPPINRLQMRRPAQGIVLAAALMLASCERPERASTPPRHPTTFVSQSPQHVAKVLSAAIGALPSQPMAGHIAEVKLGPASSDLAPGPTDRVTYVSAAVAPHTVSDWRARLAPARQRPAYAVPLCTCAWWPDAAVFDSLEFFDTGPTSPESGWVGIDGQSGTVYLLTSTR